MHTTHAAEMIQSHMWSDESQNERRARCVIRSLYVCVIANTSKIRC